MRLYLSGGQSEATENLNLINKFNVNFIMTIHLTN